MPTTRFKFPGSFTGAGLPSFTPLLNGFSKRSLIDLHRLTDASPSASARDDMTGIAVVPVPGTGVATNLSGGGLHLTKNAYVAVSSFVDLTQPYTFAAGLVLNTASATATAIMGSIDYSVRGWTIYSQPSSPTSATPVAGTMREAIDGVQSGTAILALPPASTWTYGRGVTLFLRHLGSGVAFIDAYCGATATLIFSQAYTLNTTGEQGAPGSKTTPIKFGVGGTYGNSDINLEGFALWSKALTTAEQTIAHNGFAGLASARSRAWS